MKLYERVSNLSQWLRYQATYLEMKYHLKQVLKGKEDKYMKRIGHYDRNIGKSVALARLSAQYRIPVIVPTHTWRESIEKDIPSYLPKYFKKKLPMVFVHNDISLKGNRFPVILVEERIIEERNCEIANNISYGKFVGYRNI